MWYDSVSGDVVCSTWDTDKKRWLWWWWWWWCRFLYNKVLLMDSHVWDTWVKPYLSIFSPCTLPPSRSIGLQTNPPTHSHTHSHAPWISLLASPIKYSTVMWCTGYQWNRETGGQDFSSWSKQGAWFALKCIHFYRFLTITSLFSAVHPVQAFCCWAVTYSGVNVKTDLPEL